MATDDRGWQKTGVRREGTRVSSRRMTGPVFWRELWIRLVFSLLREVRICLHFDDLLGVSLAMRCDEQNKFIRIQLAHRTFHHVITHAWSGFQEIFRRCPALHEMLYRSLRRRKTICRQQRLRRLRHVLCRYSRCSGHQEQRDQHPYKGLGSHLFSLLVICDRGAADFLICDWRNGDLQHTTSSALSCAPPGWWFSLSTGLWLIGTDTPFSAEIETGSISRKFSPGKYNGNANNDNRAAPPTGRTTIMPGCRASGADNSLATFYRFDRDGANQLHDQRRQDDECRTAPNPNQFFLDGLMERLVPDPQHPQQRIQNRVQLRVN